MRKIMIGILVMFLSMGFSAVNGYTAKTGAPAETYFKNSYNVSKLMGMQVHNQQGEELGTIKNLVADANGRIAFAIISHGGLWGIGKQLTAVPFSVLSYVPSGRFMALDMSQERFAAAPKYTKKSDLNNPEFAQNVYTFFGQQPYWTENQNQGNSQSGQAE